MKLGIYAFFHNLFQDRRVNNEGQTGAEVGLKVNKEDGQYALRRLNSFRLKQLSTGWAPRRVSQGSDRQAKDDIDRTTMPSSAGSNSAISQKAMPPQTIPSSNLAKAFSDSWTRLQAFIVAQSLEASKQIKPQELEF